MVTSISLGSFSEQNGRTVVSGSSSGGLDTQALIEALTAAKRLPAVSLEDKIEVNTKLAGAYSSLRTTLTTFSTAVDLLRNPPGVRNQDENIFEYRTTTVGGNTSGAASNYISVSAQPGASLSSYEISVDQLATYNTRVTDTFALASPDEDAVGAGLPFNAGTLLLGASQTAIEIEDDDTLNEIVAKINAVEKQTKVEASILRVADGQYRLALKTTETGTEYNYDLGIPTPPSVFDTAVFRLDAQDVNGDGDYLNNPAADQLLPAPGDVTGGTTVATSGSAPLLDVDGAPNGLATFDFSAGNQGYQVTNSTAINTGGPYSEKGFAFSFQTGADITGTQTIYEQGGTGRSFGLFIQPDSANGNQPTLFAVALNNNEWASGEEFKVLNLGTVSANTNYNVVLDFDASANPSVNDAANTFTGYVNGVQADQVTGVAEQAAHTGAIGIGVTLGGTGLPDGSTFGADGANFRGTINEIALFNQSLSSADAAEITTYFDSKYNQPVMTSSIFNVGFAINESAQDAQMTIDGTTIVRGSNSFDDVIEGLTFTLLTETQPGEQLNVNVEPDKELVKNAILNFVDAYNSFRVFLAEQTELSDDGTPTEDALLANSSTLRTISTRINTEIASVINGITGGDYDRLADIGLSFEDYEGDEETPFTRNILVVDEVELASALSANFDQVRSLFEFDFTTTDPNVTVFSRTNDLATTAITLDVDQTNGVYRATYDNGSGPQTIDLDASTLSGGGVVLTGQKGSVLEGLELIYADAGDAFGVNVSFVQGIGDRVYNALDTILDRDGGLLQTEIDTLSESSKRYQDEITRIDDVVERYREQLLMQFAALETAIAQADLILQSINAQNEARLAAS
jgi:flagellar capping protein FliD